MPGPTDERHGGAPPLPMSVRLLCAFKPQALTAVVRELTRAVFAYQRRRARKLGLRNPRCGG